MKTLSVHFMVVAWEGIYSRHNKVSIPFLLPFCFIVVLPFIVTVCHHLQQFRFTVQRELVSAELEGIIASLRGIT